MYPTHIAAHTEIPIKNLQIRQRCLRNFDSYTVWHSRIMTYYDFQSGIYCDNHTMVRLIGSRFYGQYCLTQKLSFECDLIGSFISFISFWFFITYFALLHYNFYFIYIISCYCVIKLKHQICFYDTFYAWSFLGHHILCKLFKGSLYHFTVTVTKNREWSYKRFDIWYKTTQKFFSATK